MIRLPFIHHIRNIQKRLNQDTVARLGALAQVRPGQKVRVSGYGQMKPVYRQHLRAYGLYPGSMLLVLAQNPVTMVLVDHTELAFETELARQVQVEVIR